MPPTDISGPPTIIRACRVAKTSQIPSTCYAKFHNVWSNTFNIFSRNKTSIKHIEICTNPNGRGAKGRADRRPRGRGEAGVVYILRIVHIIFLVMVLAYIV